MRLLYLINGLGPGGAERSLAGLLPHYLDAGIEPHLVCLRHRDLGVESKVRELGCDVRFLSERRLVGRVRELRGFLHGGSFDLLHTTLFESDVLGRLAAAGTGTPVLTSLVNTSDDPVRLEDPNVSRLGLAATRVADAWTARHLTTWFHAITEAVKDSSVQSMGIDPARVTVVERGRSREDLGLASPERRREGRRRLGLAENERVVVNVARQEYQKGQKHLLEAMALLKREGLEATLLICGREGHASPELRRIHTEADLGASVRFLGDRDDVPDILAAADVFAFPSVYEGLGGALIEAMALGLPIVCSRIPSLQEVVEHEGNALTVPAGNPSALGRALGRLLEDRELAIRFRRRSEEIFEERFTLERSAARMIDLYRYVAGGAVPAEGTVRREAAT